MFGFTGRCKLDEGKAWRVVGEPNGIELAKACELFFQLLFFNFISKVADIYSCAAFAAHVAVCLFVCG